jgi:hypothetical protein
MFPGLHPDEITSLYNAHGFSSSIDMISSSFGLKPSVQPTLSPRHPSSASGKRFEVVARAISKRVQVEHRVETGGNVSKLYRLHRSEAEDLARRRNVAFSGSQFAFGHGRTHDSRSLAVQGRALDIQMQQLHEEASQKIFDSRNPNTINLIPAPMQVHLPEVGSSIDVHVIDFHGLHPSEVCRIVTKVVSTVKSSLKCAHSRCGNTRIEWFAALTGEGSHSNKLGKGGGDISLKLQEELMADHQETTEFSFFQGILVIKIVK